LSEGDGPFEPAIGLLEHDSIAAGIVAGDAMVKAAPVSSLHAGTVHPGRYLVLVGGSTASVEVALEAGDGDRVVDRLFLPGVHPAVIAAITTAEAAAAFDDEALGIVETTTSAAAIVAGDAGVKAADVALPALRLADDLGGKAYCLFTGVVADVEIAVDAATAATEPGGRLVAGRVIAQLHDEMRANLGAELRFNLLLRDDGGSG